MMQDYLVTSGTFLKKSSFASCELRNLHPVRFLSEVKGSTCFGTNRVVVFQEIVP